MRIQIGIPVGIGICVAICGAMLSATSVSAADAEEIQIQSADPWSNVLADAPVRFRFRVHAGEALSGRFVWTLRANRRTMARGESAVQLVAGETVELAVPLKFPPLKPGAVLGAQLDVAVVARDANHPAATLQKTLRVFPATPFARRMQWLESLRITLYDPAGKTAPVFDEAGIPYQRVHNPAALEELREGRFGLLVIGEGTPLSGRLPATLRRLAAAGTSVLALAPVAGAIPLSSDEAADAITPRRMTFRRADVIQSLDKRLDAGGWPPSGRVIASGVSLTGDGDRVVAKVTQAESAWPWLRVDYPHGGALVVSGFGIIENWHGGPNPRYLLAALFEALTPTDETADETAEESPAGTSPDRKRSTSTTERTE